MSDGSNSSNGGIGFAGLLAILFIGLKLGHIINWSWLWVLSPLWIPFAIVIAILAMVFMFMILTVTIANLTGRGGKIELPIFLQRFLARRKARKALRQYKDRLK